MDRYWIIGGSVLLGLLLIGSIFVAMTKDETEFDPDSPEFAVQQYLRALVRSDFDAAEVLWSPDLREECSVERFALDSRWSLDRLAESRITLEEVRIAGETTLVSVSVVTTDGGGIFGPSEHSSSHTYAVGTFDGAWRITGHTWPYHECVEAHFRSKPTPPKTAAP